MFYFSPTEIIFLSPTDLTDLHRFQTFGLWLRIYRQSVRIKKNLCKSVKSVGEKYNPKKQRPNRSKICVDL